MDIALKQRLVGASVLIALAVVVLPMLLGGRQEPAAQHSQKIELPPQPAELDFETRRYPIGEAPAAGAPGAAGSPPHSAANAAAAPSAGPPVEPAVASQAPAADADGGHADDSAEPPPYDRPDDQTGDEPGAVAHVEVQPRNFQDALQGDQAVPGEAARETTGDVVGGGAEDGVAGAAEAMTRTATSALSGGPAASAAVPSVPAGTGRYVVQVGSFGSVANADHLSEALRSHGHSVLADTVQSDTGTLHRVRIGPYASEAEANEAAARVSSQVREVKPRVVDLQPEAATQVTSPSDPLVRWVVQVGSFSAAGNADALVERLRAEGLSAYREAVSSSGSTLYRVRVGPFLERDEAIRVDGLVGERLSLDGVVMSAD